MALKLQALVFILAVPLNLIWEVTQIGAYEFSPSGLMTNIVGCLVPSLGDGLMTLMIYWTGWAVFRNSQWILNPGARGYLLVVSLGMILAVVVEWNALYRTEAWAYNERMVTVPFLGVGLLPLLQMMILPIATMLLLPLVQKKRGQTV